MNNEVNKNDKDEDDDALDQTADLVGRVSDTSSLMDTISDISYINNKKKKKEADKK